MRLFPTLLAALAMILLGGCVAPTINLDRATSLVGASRHDQIRCTTQTLLSTSESSAMGLPMHWPIGREFAAQFTGGETAPAVADLLSSNLQYNIGDLGFSASFSYAASVKVKAGAREKTFDAHAEREVHGFERPETTVKTIVTTVVASLGGQIDDWLAAK